MAGPRAGFTLIELMVASLISVFIVVGAAMFIARIGRQSAAAHVEQEVQFDTMAALNMLRWDVEHVGNGIPIDVPVQLPIDLAATLVPEMTVLAQHVIRDGNGTIDGRDELFLGGIGADLTGSGGKANTLLQWNVGDSTLLLPRIDAPDVSYAIDSATNVSYMDPWGPDMGAGHAVEYASVLSPAQGWRSDAPVKIVAVEQDASGPGVLAVKIDAPVWSGGTPQRGDWVFFGRAFARADGTVVAPSHLPQARWFWQSDGQGAGSLMRQVIANPDNAVATAVDAERVFDDVVDFQVSFLVWRCNTAGPQWVDHLLDGPAATGEFAGAPYNTVPGVVGMADRFMAMRERLIAIRATLLMRERSPSPVAIDQPMLRVGVSEFQIDDHLSMGLDLRYRHYIVQQSFDPINLRIKTMPRGFESFPPVRDVATDQRMIDGGTGQCYGRPATSA